MVRYPNFTGGSYTVQNPLASFERTMNFVPTMLATPGAANRLVLDPTAGVITFAASPVSPHRGMYEHNGRVYFVAGDGFFELLDNTAVVRRGTVAFDEHPATLHANGEAGHQIYVTSGNVGYIYDTKTDAFTTTRSAGAFQGE